MISAKPPFYTYNFGTLGRTVESARETGFFRWFHLEPTERTAEEPGQVTRFRPSGEKFHELCFLDILEDQSGALVQMELVVMRGFIDGRDRLFAQDLVKSFLIAVLPDACQDVLGDLMQEFKTPGARGSLPGSLVFAGGRDAWSTQTGWSRLAMSNLDLNGQRVFVVRVSPNPKAPNATRVGSKPSRWSLRGILGLFGLTMALCGCHKPAANPELTLKGSWTATGNQVTNCGKPAPVQIENLSFVIQDAPMLNRGVSSFDLEKANVTGTVSLTLHQENSHPLTVAAGMLVGEIVNGGKSGSGGSRLQGYILTEAQYGAWVAKKLMIPPPDAGEVDFEITGNAAGGYALDGDVRSSEACGNYSHLDAVAGDLSGHFGRSVPAEWSAKVVLHKM